MKEPVSGHNWNTSQGINWWVAAYLFTSPVLAVGGVITYLYFNGIYIVSKEIF